MRWRRWTWWPSTVEKMQLPRFCEYSDECLSCGTRLVVRGADREATAERYHRWMRGHRDSLACRETRLARAVGGLPRTPFVVIDEDGQEHGVSSDELIIP